MNRRRQTASQRQRWNKVGTRSKSLCVHASAIDGFRRLMTGGMILRPSVPLIDRSLCMATASIQVSGHGRHAHEVASTFRRCPPRRRRTLYIISVQWIGGGDGRIARTADGHDARLQKLAPSLAGFQLMPAIFSTRHIYTFNSFSPFRGFRESIISIHTYSKGFLAKRSIT